VREALERQIVFLISNTGSGTRRKILDELFTPTEKLVLAKRLALVTLINKKLPTHEISDNLGVSPSTVSRFEVAVESGKYSNTSKWTKRNELETKLSELLGSLVAAAFGKRGKSFKQMVDEL